MSKRTRSTTQPGGSHATGADLPPRALRAIEGWIAGESDRQIARALRVSPSTVWRWRSNPAVAAELARLREVRWGEVYERLVEAAPLATATLVELLQDRRSPPATRAKAAGEILSRIGVTADKGATLRAEREASASFALLFERMLEAVPEAVRAEVVAKLSTPLTRTEERELVRRVRDRARAGAADPGTLTLQIARPSALAVEAVVRGDEHGEGGQES